MEAKAIKKPPQKNIKQIMPEMSPNWSQRGSQNGAKIVRNEVLEARLDARGSTILSSWGPFWGHFRFLGPCPSADFLTPCHFIFSVFQQLAIILSRLEPHRDSGFGGGIGLKSYLTVVEIWRFRYVWPRTYL